MGPSHTISKQDGSSMIPGLEELLFEHNLRDQILGSALDEIIHGQLAVSARDRQMSNLLAHLLCSLGTPLRVAESIVILGSVLVQMVDQHPTNGLLRGRKSDALWIAKNRISKKNDIC